MLIDTNVWSEIIRPKPDGRVTRFLADHSRDVFLSTIVLAEIEYGIAKAHDPIHRSRLIAYRDDVMARCADRLLSPDESAAVIWGRLKSELEGVGKPIADMDLMIASQSIAAGMPLVTRNVSDMARTGAVVIDPWQT